MGLFLSRLFLGFAANSLFGAGRPFSLPAIPGTRSSAHRRWTPLLHAGSRFTAAYTPSPICVPARASLATGLPCIGSVWDNAIAYDGRIPGWAHALRERGHHVAAIGKLDQTARREAAADGVLTAESE